MNQTQRKFLIDKIEARTKLEIEVLKKSLPERPNLEAHILHGIMSSNFDIKSTDELKKELTERVLNFKERDRLFGDGRSSWDFKNTIVFKAEDFFIVPETYKKKVEEWRRATKEANEKIDQLRIQEETLVLRIQLASPKKLQKLVNEVDDFGDLSLFDTKLKMIE